MKKILTLAVMTLSFSALADITLHQKIGPRECTITKDQTSVKYVMNNGTLGFTTTKSFSGFGYEDLAKKAAAVATQRETRFDIEASVKIEGTKYILNEEDSKEAFHLITFIGNVCK